MGRKHTKNSPSKIILGCEPYKQKIYEPPCVNQRGSRRFTELCNKPNCPGTEKCKDYAHCREELCAMQFCCYGDNCYKSFCRDAHPNESKEEWLDRVHPIQVDTVPEVVQERVEFTINQTTEITEEEFQEIMNQTLTSLFSPKTRESKKSSKARALKKSSEERKPTQSSEVNKEVVIQELITENKKLKQRLGAMEELLKTFMVNED